MEDFIKRCIDCGAFVGRKGLFGEDRTAFKIIAPDGHTFIVRENATPNVKHVVANAVEYLAVKRLERMRKGVVHHAK